ncbi:hypothetical protein GTA51_04965 [Desulfovibrio aerotolerans]|uniref:Uncharacterized protein n=1 Tax=Solidesulfovibrio aerotolerans TaxID=295255 RepID=A0A7C9MHA6_9BACT|nr:hypothetical protein [Solidesulfovibrio aerotolerans]MYL82488.1 hypothetical protein [Solidesulfovibrio aerotolerans]
MHQPPPHAQRLTSLDDLTRLMAQVAVLRRTAVAALLAGRPLPTEVTAHLAHSLEELRKAAGRDHIAELTRGDDVSLRLDLAEEIRQLENDGVYLEDGREALVKRLGKHRSGLRDAIRRGLKTIAGETVKALVCDCDALFRAPDQRVRTAVQPAWNAVAACRFAMARSRKPLLWSEAPLTGPGIVDRAVVPPQTFAYAGSLGRQWQDAEGNQGQAPLSPEKTALLDAINERLASLMADPAWLAFTYVGAGLQFRRGETSITRQDHANSIDEDASLALLEHVHDVIDAVDPERQHFRVDDDGHDITVTPTAAKRDLWNDFSPAEGLRHLDAALGLNLAHGPHLVCCAGPQGVALLAAMAEWSTDLRAILVTDRDDLATRATAICPRTTVVRHPDTVAAILSAAAP